MRDNNPGISEPLKWGLWGGGIEPEDADYKIAAVRELEEELGVKTHMSDYKLVYEYTTSQGFKGYLVALSQPLEWADIRVMEGAGAGYFTFDEIKQIPVSNHMKLSLEKHPEVFA